MSRIVKIKNVKNQDIVKLDYILHIISGILE